MSQGIRRPEKREKGRGTRPGPLFEGNPVGEVTIRRGTDTPVRHPEKPAVSTHSLTRCVRHPEQFERQADDSSDLAAAAAGMEKAMAPHSSTLAWKIP